MDLTEVKLDVEEVRSIEKEEFEKIDLSDLEEFSVTKGA